MAALPRLPPVEQRILNLLSDGRGHTRQEIHSCLDDELAQLTAIRRPISHLRKILRPKGEDIICQMLNKDILYRHVRLLSPG